MKTIKILVLILTIALIPFPISFAYAEENADNARELRTGATLVLSVPLYQQPYNSNKCGPTCCRMILKYFGYTKTLEQIVSEMSSMPEGDYTHIDSQKRMLNNYISGNPYAKYSNSTKSFSSAIVPSINAGYPLMCQVKTSYLPVYNNQVYWHYVVARGYLWAQGGNTGGTNTVYYADPHYNSTYYGYNTCTYQQMQNAICGHSGLYLAYKTLG